MEKISKNVYVETGFPGCNVSFLVTKAGIVMIDTPQMPKDIFKWKEEISKHGPVRFMINNEPHFDHITGNCFFDGILIAHKGTRERILQSSVEMVENMMKNMAPDAPPMPKEFRLRPPDITITDNMTLYPGDHTVEIMYMPGHTLAQLAVYVPEEGVVFTSDNVVNGSEPFLIEAEPYLWIESLNRIEKLGADTVVTGHGSVCNKSYIPVMRNIIQTWITMITDAKKKGMPLEQAQDIKYINKYFPEAAEDAFMGPARRDMVAHMYEVIK